MKNETFKFNNTIVFINKITHVVIKNAPILHDRDISKDKWRSNKERDEEGRVLYHTNIKIYLDNGNFIEFKELNANESKDIQLKIKNK